MRVSSPDVAITGDFAPCLQNLAPLTPREGTRDAVEAWGDEVAAFNDGESPYRLALRLCGGRFDSFDLGRALLAGGAMGMRGDTGEGARRPDGDTC